MSVSKPWIVVLGALASLAAIIGGAILLNSGVSGIAEVAAGLGGELASALIGLALILLGAFVLLFGGRRLFRRGSGGGKAGGGGTE